MKTILRRKREIALFLLVTLCAQIFYVPASAQVRTIVPSAATTEVCKMVDLFSGDLNYTVPIFNIPAASGSYPINLTYKSGNYATAESSWVGLGWELSMPSIKRQVKGVPDEFSGDSIQAMYAIQPSITIGAGAGVGKEVLGKTSSEKLDNGIGTFNVYQNNIHGLGYRIDNNVGYHAAIGSYETNVLNNPSIDPNEAYNSLPFLGLKTNFSHPLLQSPRIPVALQNTTTTINHKTGNAWAGSFAHGFLTGYYNVQQLAHDSKFVSYQAVGALHSEKEFKEAYVVDVQNSPETPFTRNNDLAFSSLSTDKFVLSGGGPDQTLHLINDNTYVLPQLVNRTASFARGLGEDKSIALHNGSNSSMLAAVTYTGDWNDSSSVDQSLKLLKSNPSTAFDISTNSYGSYHNNSWRTTIDPLRLTLLGKGKNVQVKGDLFSTQHKLSQTQKQNKGKANAIHALTNGDILNQDGKEITPELTLMYRDATGMETKFDRSKLPQHHLAAITLLQPNGTRYTYGLPSYALTHEEIVFSGMKFGNTNFVNVGQEKNDIPFYKHQGVAEYLSYIKTPKYAESHLLTSIMGADYIDLGGDGLTSDDLGYWVKFSYRKVTTDADAYKVREPFVKAHLIDGNSSSLKDDKGVYTYTEKELWYVDQIETSTHTVKFITQERLDGYGAKNRLQDEAMLGKAPHALKEIRIYAKEGISKEAAKIIKFEYDYSLFPKSANSVDGKGKLTLKKLWVEYANNAGGKQEQYEFNYNTDFGFAGLVTDRWGISSSLKNPVSSVFVDQQFSAKKERDRAVAIGNLSSIKVPGGQTIAIQYESDDYAYVQHLPAQQMTPLAIGNSISDQDLKIKFKLESPISATASPDEQQAALNRYINSSKELYVKLRINLLSKGANQYEWIDGNVTIDVSRPMGLEKDESGSYAFGYLYVKSVNGYNPFSVEAWNHIRNTASSIVGAPFSIMPTSDSRLQNNQIESVIAASAHIRSIYQDFFKYCNERGFGREVDNANAYVRLASPDKIKLGGEARVKQITMTDGWEEDEQGVRGYWFDYTKEENGSVISSGVAKNEPAVGKEENVLLQRFPQLESIYPEAGIGYSQIHVYTLAAASLAGKTLDNVSLFPKGDGVTHGTKGVTTYQFYTANEFPTIVSSTGRDNKSYAVENQSATVNQLVSSQGYCVARNDMHGKLKSISYFRQQENGMIESIPVAHEKHAYFSKPYLYDGQRVFVVTNSAAQDDDGLLQIDNNGDAITLGSNEESFVDLREVADNSWRMGSDVNDDDMSMSLFSESTLPIHVKGKTENSLYVSNILKTSVFSRIIDQSGLESSKEEYNNGQQETIQYLKFDKVTSTPVLSKKSNGTKEFVFEKLFLAHHNYKGMGPASLNLGKTAAISNVKQMATGKYVFTLAKNNDLFAGDELVMFGSDSNGITRPISKAIYLGIVNGLHQLETVSILNEDHYAVKIVRSGNRNQLEATSGKINAKREPTWKNGQSSVSRTFVIPKY